MTDEKKTAMGKALEVSEWLKDLIDSKLSYRAIENWINVAELSELARLQRDTKQLADTLKETRAIVNVVYDKLRTAKIPDKMEDEGIEKVSFEGVGRISLTVDAYVSVLAENRPALHQWLTANGHDDLISDTVNSSTLKAFVLNRSKEGEEIPSMVKFEPYTRASITKETKK
jgi:hypothetical protein